MIRRTAEEINRIEFFVEIDLSTADPFGLEVGGFYDRHPLGRYLSGRASSDTGEYLTTRQAAHFVARWTHGNHLIGIVPNFDTEVLANLLRAEKLTPAWHYHLADAETMAVGWLHGVAARAIDEARMRGEEPDPGLLDRRKGAPPWNSEEVSRALGVDPPTKELRHTAMGDADWAMRMYDRITGGED